MVITNSDSLPQVSVVVNDGGLRVAPPQLGPKLTILGATNATGILVNEVYVVDDLSKAVVALRNSTNVPSELSIAVEEAFAAGARNVEVVKISSVSALDGAGGYDSQLRYAALAVTYDALLNHPVDIVVPVNAWIDDRDISAADNFGKQLADFCYQSTKENNTGFGVIAPMHTATQALRDAAGWTDWATDYTAADGLFGDITLAQTAAWATDLADQTSTHLNDYVDGSDDQSYAVSYKTAWTASDTTLGAAGSAADSNGLWIDSGQFISVFASPNRYVGPEARKLATSTGGTAAGKSFVNSDGAVAYAAKLTTLDPHMAVTNKSIFGQRSARALSASQAKGLLNARFVSMFTKPAGYVVSSGITGAHNASISERSDFVRITTVRITHAVIDAVREAGEAFIGKPISTPYVNAMESQIESTLQSIARSGAIRSYDFSIAASPDQQVLGEVSVSLTIVPAFELTEIKTTVSLIKGEGIG